MRVALGVGTGRLIFNRPDHTQHAFATGLSEDSRAIRTVEAHHRRGLSVAAVTGLSLLVYNASGFFGIGRKTDASFFVENANAADAGLAAHVTNGLVERVPVVVQHLVPRAAPDNVADAIRALQHQLFRVTLVRPQIQITQTAEDDRCAQYQPKAQLVSQARVFPEH